MRRPTSSPDGCYVRHSQQPRFATWPKFKPKTGNKAPKKKKKKAVAQKRGGQVRVGLGGHTVTFLDININSHSQAPTTHPALPQYCTHLVFSLRLPLSFQWRLPSLPSLSLLLPQLMEPPVLDPFASSLFPPSATRSVRRIVVLSVCLRCSFALVFIHFSLLFWLLRSAL